MSLLLEQQREVFAPYRDALVELGGDIGVTLRLPLELHDQGLLSRGAPRRDRVVHDEHGRAHEDHRARSDRDATSERCMMWSSASSCSGPP